uniref:O-methyltransferase n=1 Tax=Solanum tuberosum TaxID=4113 RepID=M1AVK2_SOLTU
MALPNDNIEEKTRQVLSGHAHILNLSLSFINTMSLKCAIQLGIPDIIHSHGRAMTLSDLVNTLSINKSRGQDCVYRLMRILIHAGLFIEEEEEGYLLTPNSRLLLKDEPLSLVPLVYSGLDPNSMDPFHYLSQWFQNDDSCTPFASIYGKSLYEYAEKEPILNHLLNKGMASDARLVMSVLIQNGKGLLFQGLKSLWTLRGHWNWLEGSKNLNFVGGDMFNSIPCADAVLLKWILHNWEDEDCIKILKKCKEAIPSKENGGRVIIIEIVMDQNKDDKLYETQLFYDMLMMVLLGGKERSEQEWAKLFFDAGFSDYNIIPILGLRSVIEVYP